MNRKTLNIDHHKNAGCSYHRVWLPVTQMSGSVFDSIMHRNDRYMNENDILFFNRVPLKEIERLEEWKMCGAKIVVDIDDHWILYPHHEMAATWMKSKAHEQIQYCLSVADMVFTTNERLKIAASHLCSNVHVVPNGLLFERDQFILDEIFQPTYHDKVTFMYAAGSSHEHDLNVLKPVMKRLYSDAQFRKEGEIILAGYQNPYGTGNVNSPWTKMLNIVKSSGSFSTIANLPLEQYMKCYNVACVALAPLEDNTFNACKSNLKILEAGCKNIPIIASAVEPYIFDRECPGVILCNTPREWYEAIKMLLNDSHMRHDLGIQLGNYVREKYHLSRFVDQRLELFKTL